ncbi:uncharacterized protein EI97DRAFT_459935 [Westerdykella ornata]|uniref:Vacuolar segregation subunit 7 n=1 Tax=Westerdykella ornata TaxID=318751 RepID=A0A6A6JEG5_WESOR|nr:uncharacterized protein EI97DRAFT_459935 [Westerdykella ornata]KAF2274655.1 hypothetical protein EI97DRAFT_459935 [Westerdykella ornata]
MSSNDNSARSTVAAVADPAEPAATTPTTTTATPQPPPHNTPQPPMPPTHDTSANRRPTPASAVNTADATGRRQRALGASSSRNASASPSTLQSPTSSRDTSPSRQPQRLQGSTAAPLRSGLRSRKNSIDVSPSGAPGVAGSNATGPSAAAIQRALSSATTPQLSPAPPQDFTRASGPLKGASASSSGENTPRWPVSPRLKSPPPNPDNRSRSRRNSLRAQNAKKPDIPATPSIVVQSSSPVPSSRLPVQDEEGIEDVEDQQITMKAPSRGVAPKLETVQEASVPTTPSFEGLEIGSVVSSLHSQRSSDDERHDVTSTKVTEDLSARTSRHSESGGENNDSKTKMQERRSSSAQRPATLTPRASYSSLSTIKSRTDVPTRNMTVETETVPSVPSQSNIGNQDRSASGRAEGSLRQKPSSETIRPKKEKSRPKRKAPSIVSGTGRSPTFFNARHHHHRHSATVSLLGSPGSSYCSYDDPRLTIDESPPNPEMPRPSFRPTLLYSYSFSSANGSARKASSKADVFEQKVASAVDEANSSDSEATFIYESNPPEPQPHRSRHHSRTPSMTSIASVADRGVRDAHRNMGKKTSMKFANPYANQNAELGFSDHGDGTVRVGSGRISAAGHHHHIGRHGHGRGALNHLLVDSDSSLAQSSRIAAARAGSRHTSQPNSPRFQNFAVSNMTNYNDAIKNREHSTYDMDTENAADDERTPLVSSIRSPRARGPRQRNGILIRHQDRRHRRGTGWFRRIAGCLVLSVLVLLLVFGAVGLIFATTKPLTDVKIRAIQDVVASQEELMFDLFVEAVNPNVIGVTVADMDMNIFARSKHVGSDKWWREHGGEHGNEENWQHISDSAAAPVELNHARTKGVDEGTDPVEDPEIGEPRTMLLGRIFHFDSPLAFDGSFFKRHKSQSLGALRLQKPGNKTEAGGTERWEEVLQYPFDLIVKGVFKYQLPLSTQERKVAVNASYHYDPDTEKKKLKAASSRKRQLLPTPVNLPWGRYARGLAEANAAAYS